jgi:hypothetical protein
MQPDSSQERVQQGSVAVGPSMKALMQLRLLECSTGHWLWVARFPIQLATGMELSPDQATINRWLSTEAMGLMIPTWAVHILAR